MPDEFDVDINAPEPPPSWTYPPALYKRMHGALKEAALGREASTKLATVTAELAAVRTDAEAAKTKVAELEPRATAADQIARERDQLSRQLVGVRAGIDDPEIVDVAVSRYDRYVAAQTPGTAKPFDQWLPTDGKADKVLAPHFAQPATTTTAPVPGAAPQTPAQPPAPPPPRPPSTQITPTDPVTQTAPPLSAAELNARRHANGGRLDAETADRARWELQHPNKPYPGFGKS